MEPARVDGCLMTVGDLLVVGGMLLDLLPSRCSPGGTCTNPYLGEALGWIVVGAATLAGAGLLRVVRRRGRWPRGRIGDAGAGPK